MKALKCKMLKLLMLHANTIRFNVCIYIYINVKMYILNSTQDFHLLFHYLI